MQNVEFLTKSNVEWWEYWVYAGKLNSVARCCQLDAEFIGSNCGKIGTAAVVMLTLKYYYRCQFPLHFPQKPLRSGGEVQDPFSGGVDFPLVGPGSQSRSNLFS